jgi:hypothetical protein
MDHRSAVVLQPLAKARDGDERHDYDHDFHFALPSFRTFILADRWLGCAADLGIWVQPEGNVARIKERVR